MARSREDALTRKVRQELEAKQKQQFLSGVDTQAQSVSPRDLGERKGMVEKLLKEGTNIVHRKLTGDSAKRKYRKVNTQDNIWDFLITLDKRDRENITPKKIMGTGAFGAVFGGKIAYNEYNCREFYAQEEAQEFLKTGDMLEKLCDILGVDEIPVEELIGEHRDMVFAAVYQDALKEAEAMSNKEIVQIMKTRFKKIAPKGNICIKLAWLASDFLRLYKREKMVAGLDHKNLAYVLAVDEVPRPTADTEEAKLIMTAQQHIADEMTADELAETGLEQKIDIAVQIGDGLREIHRLGLMHRDFKRSNVLITKDGTPKIIDTGFMKKLDGRQTSVTGLGEVLGTPHYFPPEQAVGDLIDARADIYAVGATLYEYMVGESPNALITSAPRGVIAMLLSNDTLPLMPSQTKGVQNLVQRYIKEKGLSQIESPKILQNIDLVMAKLLHRDKNKRYQTVSAYMADLNALKIGEEPPVVNEDLKVREISAERFKQESFKYYLREYDKTLYHDADKSQILQVRSGQGNIAVRYLAKPALRVLKPIGAALALTATAAVAGGTALAIAYPDLAKQALDYIIGK